MPLPPPTPQKKCNLAYLYPCLHTGIPSTPQDVRLASEPVQVMDSAMVTIQWNISPPQIVNTTYTVIVSSGLSMVLIPPTSSTSSVLTLPYNLRHNISVVATNCVGNSTSESISVSISKYLLGIFVQCMYNLWLSV